MSEQVGGVREELISLRTELGGIRTYCGEHFDQTYSAINTHIEEDKHYREEEMKRKEDEQAYMANYNQMMHDMHAFLFHFLFQTY